LPPPPRKDPSPLTGIAQCISEFEVERPDPSKFVDIESTFVKRKRIMLDRKAKNDKKVKEAIAKWNPKDDSKITSDPYHTLIVYNIVCIIICCMV
jgi:hypothetical protein